MFLIALNPSQEPSLPPGGLTRTLACRGQSLLIAWGGPFTHCTISEDRAVITESSAGPEWDRENHLIRADIDLLRGSIHIAKARDAGKALYYSQLNSGSLWVATHIDLMRRAGLRLAQNDSVLPEFMRYRFITAPETLYQGVRQLPNEQSLAIALHEGGTSLEVANHLRLPTRAGGPVSDQQAAERARSTLQRALETHTSGVDRLCTLFSGGLDSSLLANINRSLCPEAVAYSASFPFEAQGLNKEKLYADTSAKAQGLNHVHFQGDIRGWLTGIVRATSAAEYPIHHLQSAMIFQVMERIPESTPVVLCGDGADGIWGSGTSYLIVRNQRPLMRLLATPAGKSLIRLVVGLLGQEGSKGASLDIRDSGAVALEDPDHFIWGIHSYGDRDWICDYFQVVPGDLMPRRLKILEPWRDHSLLDLIAVQGFLDESSATQPVWTKFAEAFDKTVYYPFYQPEHMDFALSLPWKVKLKRPKHILRELGIQLGIPPEVVNRPKSSFGIRRHDWARQGGVIEPLLGLAAPVHDPEALRGLQGDNPSHAMTIWSLVSHAIWKRIWIDGESEESLLSELEENLARWDNYLEG